MKLVGLEHRMKSEQRFREKVAEELAATFRDSVTEIAGRVPNTVRYAYQLTTGSFLLEFHRAIERLAERGDELVFVKNLWGDSKYTGIVTRWRTQGGQIFEVQFHTSASFAARQRTHGAYRKIRSPLSDGREVERATAYLREVSSTVPIPGGALTVGDYRANSS